MKKFLIVFTGALLSTLFIACNGANQNNDVHKDSAAGTRQTMAAAQPDSCEGIGEIDICTNSKGIDNFIIEEAEGRTMMADFISIYRRDDQGRVIIALDSTYWLSACAVYAIETLLRNSRKPDGTLKYDGIRIHLACEVNANPGTFPGQQYQNQSSAFIFPTMYRVAPGPNKSEHVDDRIRIPLTGGCTSPLLQDNSVARPKIEAFRSVYRREQTPQVKNALSRSVWVESCVVYAMAALLRLPNAKLDGVNINLAAYNTLDPQRTPGQIDQKQSTAILIPTSWVDGKHKDNWAIVDCLLKHAKALGWAPGGLNHGELCPQQCE